MADTTTPHSQLTDVVLFCKSTIRFIFSIILVELKAAVLQQEMKSVQLILTLQKPVWESA